MLEKKEGINTWATPKNFEVIKPSNIQRSVSCTQNSFPKKEQQQTKSQDPKQNLQYFWKKGTRTGPGLNNLGNTCFMNSVLQCLVHTTPLTNLMQEDNHKSKCSKKNGFCGVCFWENHTKASFQGKQGAQSPTPLFNNLRSISSHLRPGRQHDAHEFLVNFLDNLEKGYENSNPKTNQSQKLQLDNSLPNTDSKSQNPIKTIFNGETVSQVKCLRCGYCSNTFETYTGLTLDLLKNTTLINCLNSFFKVDKLAGDNQYQCSRCKKKVDAEKRYYLKKTPDNLIIHLKRFDNFRNKVSKPIEYEQSLSLKKYQQPNAVGVKMNYELYGVVIHIGGTLNGGHYIAYIKNPEDKWCIMDDSRVSLNSNNGESNGAYILFYRAKEQQQQENVSAEKKQQKAGGPQEKSIAVDVTTPKIETNGSNGNGVNKVTTPKIETNGSNGNGVNKDTNQIVRKDSKFSENGDWDTLSRKDKQKLKKKQKKQEKKKESKKEKKKEKARSNYIEKIYEGREDQNGMKPKPKRITFDEKESKLVFPARIDNVFKQDEEVPCNLMLQKTQSAIIEKSDITNKSAGLLGKREAIDRNRTLTIDQKDKNLMINGFKQDQAMFDKIMQISSAVLYR